MKTLLLVHRRHLLAVTSHGRRAKGTLSGLFNKGTSPVLRALALPSWPNHLPKAALPNTITLGIRFQHMNLGQGILKNSVFRRLYKVCPESIHPCTRKNRDIYWRRYKIQETLYIGQFYTSVPFKVRHLGTTHSSPNISFMVQNILQNLFLE